MSLGSVFGECFCVSTWGESHGFGVGVVIDGCPAGLPLSEADIQTLLDRRKPGKTRYSTPRKEEDTVQILSGVFEGKTTGTPIAMMVENKNEHSADYEKIAEVFRPGHADYTYEKKYGFRDYRGGGRSSGRETIARVAAGAVAEKILGELGVTVTAYTKEIGGITADCTKIDKKVIGQSPLYMPDLEASKRAEDLLLQKMEQKDSVGGIIECVISHLPAGVGNPVFEKLDANLAKAVMSVGAVKGVEIGDGFLAAQHFGSENNDAFLQGKDNRVAKKTNHAGGILGGISDGDNIILRAAVKPTPSIAQTQKTVNSSGKEVEITVHGRHDPVIVPRAVVVVESMAALAVLDMLLLSMTDRLDKIKRFFDLTD